MLMAMSSHTHTMHVVAGGGAGAALEQGEEEEDVWESAMAAVAATTTAASPARPPKPSSSDPALASTSAAPPSLPFIAPPMPLPAPSMDGSFSAMSTALQHHDDDDPFADIANSPVRAATAPPPVLPPLSLSGLTGGMQAEPMAAALPPVSSLLVEEDLLAPSTVMAEDPLSSAGQLVDMAMQVRLQTISFSAERIMSWQVTPTHITSGYTHVHPLPCFTALEGMGWGPTEHYNTHPP